MLHCSSALGRGPDMTTIAADILRAVHDRREQVGPTAPYTEPDTHAVRRLMRQLCEEAQGIRIAFDAWVFPDGSELHS